MITKWIFSLLTGWTHVAMSASMHSHLFAATRSVAYFLGSWCFRSVQTGHFHDFATCSTLSSTPRSFKARIKFFMLLCPVFRCICWIFFSISFLSSSAISNCPSGSSGISSSSSSSAAKTSCCSSWEILGHVSRSLKQSVSLRTKAVVYRAVCAVCPASHFPLAWFFWHRRFICCKIFAFFVAIVQPLHKIFCWSTVFKPTVHPWHVAFCIPWRCKKSCIIGSCHASHRSASSQCTWVPSWKAVSATSIAPWYWFLACSCFSSSLCLCSGVFLFNRWRGQYGLHSQLIHKCTGRKRRSIFLVCFTPSGVSRSPPFQLLTRIADPLPNTRSTSVLNKLFGKHASSINMGLLWWTSDCQFWL